MPIESSLKLLTNGRWVQLVTHGSTSVVYLSRAICKLLHESRNLHSARNYMVGSFIISKNIYIENMFRQSYNK